MELSEQYVSMTFSTGVEGFAVELLNHRETTDVMNESHCCHGDSSTCTMPNMDVVQIHFTECKGFLPVLLFTSFVE